MAKKDDSQDRLYNLQAQQLASQVANWAATLDFQKERFRLLEMPQFQASTQLEVDKLAWQKAQDTWERSFQEASITGMYQGQPTTQWLMDQARLTGSFNGQQTLEGKLTDAQVQDMHDKMNLANAQFLSATTGYLNGQKTFDREKFEAAQGLEGWKFISSLSGPQNAFKQARAIGNLPGGMAGLMGAYAGQYMLPSGTSVGAGGYGSANTAGQLSDMLLGAGNGNPPPPPPGGFVPPYPTPQYTPTQYGPQAPFVPVAPYIPPPGTPPAPPPTPAAPSPPAPPAGPDWAWFNPIPRPSDPDYADTTARWNAAHPGYALDSSPVGFHSTGGAPMPNTHGQYPDVDAQAAGASGGYTLPPPSPGYSYQAPQAQAAAAQTVGGYSYQAPGVQAPVNAYNYSTDGTGSVGVYPPGVASPAHTADVSSVAPMSASQAAPLVNQPYQYGGAYVYNTGGSTSMGGTVPLPNQINAQNYGNSYDYQKELLWANYEDQGWDKGLAQEAFAKSLPKYQGITKGSVAF